MATVESAVAVNHTHLDAEQAVKELQKAGVDIHTLSIAAKDSHTDKQVVGYNAGDQVKRSAQDAFGGGFWTLMFGSASISTPGIGPLFVAGPLVAWTETESLDLLERTVSLVGADVDLLISA